VKKRKTTLGRDDIKSITNDDVKDEDDENGKPETKQNLYEYAMAFIEMVFVSKLDKATRKPPSLVCLIVAG